MTKLETYCDLRDAVAQAAQLRKECELELFAALEAIDPELVNDGLDLMTSADAREVLAHHLMESIPALGSHLLRDAHLRRARSCHPVIRRYPAWRIPLGDISH